MGNSRKSLDIEHDFMFEVNAVQGCNLNCASCCEFSQYCSPKDCFDLELYEKHMSRISLLTNRKAESTRIIGGEPLLHPEIWKFPQIARKYFDCPIKVVTNGVCLKPKFRNIGKFVDSCINNDVKVSVTVYPVVSHDLDFYETLRARGLNLKLDSDVSKDESEHSDSVFKKVQDRHWCKTAYDFSGEQNPSEAFSKCSSGKFCAQLDYSGKLWKCPRPSMSHYWNAKFPNKQLVATNGDYMDIYDYEFTPERFMTMMHSPVPFCRYCYFDSKSKANDHVRWRLSRESKNPFSEYDKDVPWDE
jgi:organic radical activating enzyme